MTIVGNQLETSRAVLRVLAATHAVCALPGVVVGSFVGPGLLLFSIVVFASGMLIFALTANSIARALPPRFLPWGVYGCSALLLVLGVARAQEIARHSPLAGVAWAFGIVIAPLAALFVAIRSGQ